MVLCVYYSSVVATVHIVLYSKLEKSLSQRVNRKYIIFSIPLDNHWVVTFANEGLMSDSMVNNQNFMSGKCNNFNFTFINSFYALWMLFLEQVLNMKHSHWSLQIQYLCVAVSFYHDKKGENS